MTYRLLLITTAALLTGCEIPGMGPSAQDLQREAEAKAIGSACRHGLRSIEDCYILNDKVSKSAIFDGWKTMDEYMRENSIEGVRATLSPPKPAAEVIEGDKAAIDPKADQDEDEEPAPKAKSSKKTAAH